MPTIAFSAKKHETVLHRPGGDDFFVPTELVLSDGARFSGVAPKGQRGITGEVVFNTGMTGYIESLTDPSYSGQILVFTYPLIGNYGVLAESAWESDRVHARGVVVSEACLEWSHTDATESFLDWLQEQNVPVIMDVDTRTLTKHLRTSGTMMGAIGAEPAANVWAGTVHVSIDEPVVYNQGRGKRVIAVDCGMKSGILNSLLAMDIEIKRVPMNYDYTNEEYDGVLLSNGPGDPTDYPKTIEIAKKAMDLGKPVFGICLGSQLMGLAAGATTYKLKFGHRGHNQPCMVADKKCYITSQNHGYALDGDTLPGEWRVLLHNLNDGSVEGIEHRSKPFFSVQFHPEAKPGPTDTGWLFERFYQSL